MGSYTLPLRDALRWERYLATCVLFPPV